MCQFLYRPTIELFKLGESEVSTLLPSCLSTANVQGLLYENGTQYIEHCVYTIRVRRHLIFLHEVKSVI